MKEKVHLSNPADKAEQTEIMNRIPRISHHSDYNIPHADSQILRLGMYLHD